jgi:hypothetical protein
MTTGTNKKGHRSFMFGAFLVFKIIGSLISFGVFAMLLVNHWSIFSHIIFGTPLG